MFLGQQLAVRELIPRYRVQSRVRHARCKKPRVRLDWMGYLISLEISPEPHHTHKSRITHTKAHRQREREGARENTSVPHLLALDAHEIEQGEENARRPARRRSSEHPPPFVYGQQLPIERDNCLFSLQKVPLERERERARARATTNEQ